MAKRFWKIQNAVERDGSELILEGEISSELWFGNEVTPKALRDELSQTDGPLTVVINSVGGEVFAGVQIYNMLRNRGNITVRIDGIAGSIASVIAMAGDEIIMSAGSVMMVHKPSMGVAGNSSDMDDAKKILELLEREITEIYTARTGLSTERVTELLTGDNGLGTWLGGAEAVELGFADRAITEEKVTDSITNAIKAMMSGNLQFSMAVSKESLDAFAKEVKMTEDETKVEVKEEEIKEVDETETVNETDTEVENSEEQSEEETVEEKEPEAEKITNKVKEIKEMDKTQDEIAIENIAKPSADVTPAVDIKSYLASPKAMEEFAKILEANAAGGSAKDLAGTGASDAVRDAWKEHLEVTMGVTNPQIFLPTPLITEIEDAFKAGGEIWNRVFKTGLDSFNSAWDANDDPDEEKGRASGYNRAKKADKREQELTFASRILRPQFVYKYITLNKEDVKEQRSTGALVKFVLAELPRRIIREVERAIVIGDGRATGSDYKIQNGNPRGFYSIAADAANEDIATATVYSPKAGETVYETLSRARAEIKADGEVLLVAKSSYLLDMQFEQSVNGGFLFQPGTDPSKILNVSAIVSPDWFEGNTNYDAIFFVPSKYRVVGDQSVEAFQNFILKTNKNEYLQEIWAGGGLTVRRSGVVVESTDASL